MELSEKRIDIAHRLYQCRKTAKNLLGDQYLGKMAEYQVLIREWMQSTGFFGDTLKSGAELDAQWANDAADNLHHWGSRHYWYWCMCMLLFLLSILRICIWGYYYWEGEQKQS